jgi:ferredoxin-NADP reductase
LGSAQTLYVCGSPRFAEYAESLLVDCGVDPSMIRVEQFGATG